MTAPTGCTWCGRPGHVEADHPLPNTLRAAAARKRINALIEASSLEAEADWAPGRASTTGACHYCGDHRPLRTEPFGQVPACRTCWEQICFGEED